MTVKQGIRLRRMKDFLVYDNPWFHHLSRRRQLHEDGADAGYWDRLSTCT